MTHDLESVVLRPRGIHEYEYSPATRFMSTSVHTFLDIQESEYSFFSVFRFNSREYTRLHELL